MNKTIIILEILVDYSKKYYFSIKLRFREIEGFILSYIIIYIKSETDITILIFYYES